MQNTFLSFLCSLDWKEGLAKKKVVCVFVCGGQKNICYWWFIGTLFFWPLIMMDVFFDPWSWWVFFWPLIMKKIFFSTPPWKFYFSTLVIKKCSFDPNAWKIFFPKIHPYPPSGSPTTDFFLTRIFFDPPSKILFFDPGYEWKIFFSKGSFSLIRRLWSPTVDFFWQNFFWPQNFIFRPWLWKKYSFGSSAWKKFFSKIHLYPPSGSFSLIRRLWSPTVDFFWQNFFRPPPSKFYFSTLVMKKIFFWLQRMKKIFFENSPVLPLRVLFWNRTPVVPYGRFFEKKKFCRKSLRLMQFFTLITNMTFISVLEFKYFQ